jgi:hypothetical protein
MSDNEPPIMDGDLRIMLRKLLSSAGPDGSLNPDLFWIFVAALAHGRGISDGLHSAGIDALSKVPSSPATTRIKRQQRAYHLGLLVQFLADAGGVPGRPSVFPGSFNRGLVMADLLLMLGGKGKMGDGTPQVLTSARAGKAALRRDARLTVVGVVLWRAGRTGQDAVALWADLMGIDGEKRWWSEVGGRKGDFARHAWAAGQANDTESRYAATTADLIEVIRLANSGPGRRGSKSQKVV